MKKFTSYIIILSLIVLVFPFLVSGEEVSRGIENEFSSNSPENNLSGKAEIKFFYSKTCPNCAQAEKFLNELEKKYPQIEIKRYEFSKHIELVKKLYEDYKVPSQKQGYVPIIFTDTRYFVGFSEQVGKEIESCIKECLTGEEALFQKIKIPIFGEIDIENFSLPLLAIILGLLDGFNICSLGALVLILGLVIALKSKKKILILGGAFILISVAVYWFLVFLWHQLFVFISPYIRGMEILISLFALAGGIYFTKEFIDSRKRGALCKFGGVSENLTNKVRNIFEKKSGILMMLVAVSLFAVAVTVIEFPCTAFFPVLFTGILAQADITFYLSLFYISLYIFFYTLDEIIVFLIAVFTMKVWIVSPRFIIWLNLSMAIMLFLLGIYYFFGKF